jgi:acarbose 7IV-phosphotransferase
MRELDVLAHPSGTRRAVNLVTPDGSRLSLYDPRPLVDLAGDRSLWRDGIGRARHVLVTIMAWAAPALADAVSAGRSTSTDLHDWDGENPHHRPFALGADLVLFVRDADPVLVPAVTLAARPAVDSNGAGDAYVAAHLSAWLAGSSQGDAAWPARSRAPGRAAVPERIPASWTKRRFVDCSAEPTRALFE